MSIDPYPTTEHGNTEGSNSSWIFTINNPTGDCYAQVNALTAISNRLFVSLEEGQDTHTPHFQGYVTFKGGKRFTAVRKLLPRARLAKAKGTYKQNHGYIFKEGSAKIHDINNSNQGERNEIDDAIDMLNAHGKRKCALTMGSTVVKHHRGLLERQRWLYTTRTTKPLVIWCYGLAGAGKTNYVCERYVPEHLYKWYGDKWFDGYTQQHVCLLDELGNNRMPYKSLLSLLDRYQHYVQPKGSYCEFNSPLIFITAPCNAEYTYGQHCDQYNTIEQLHRRIDYSLHFTKTDGQYHIQAHDTDLNEIPLATVEAALEAASPQAEVQEDAPEPERGSEMATQDSSQD